MVLHPPEVGGDSCSGGGGRRAAAAAGGPPGPRGPVPGRRSGGVHGGAATVACERGAREHGPEAAAAEAELSILMKM